MTEIDSIETSKFIDSVDNEFHLSLDGKLVLPGDKLSHLIKQTEKKKIILSNGLSLSNEIEVRKAGSLKFRSPSTFYVESLSQFYQPQIGDQVIGIIEEKGGDYYKVNIFTGTCAILSRLAFEGATKRNKPELKSGDVIYARVISNNKYLDTEIVCTTASGPKKDWNTGENVYGELTGDGVIVQLSSISDVSKYLSPSCILLSALARKFQYEIAIGMNGVLWVRASNLIHTIVIRNAIMNADRLADEVQIMAMVDRLALIAKTFLSS